MCKKSTTWILTATVLSASAVLAQTLPDWRHVGNTNVDLALAGLATGPVDRVSYSPDGSKLVIRTASGHVFETSDFETWHAAANDPSPAVRAIGTRTLPETGAQARNSFPGSPRMYAFGKFAYRSDDGGASWESLTAYRASSIVGNGLRDLTVSPVNEEDIVVATAAGVFRSLDGGKSWSGMNEGLANLPVTRLLSLPSGERGVRVALNDESVIEWEPGQKQAWLPAPNSDVLDDLHRRQALSIQLHGTVTATEARRDFIYAGTEDGQLNVSSDRGASWLNFAVNLGGAVERFWVDSGDPRVALAVLRTRSDAGSLQSSMRVMRTQNGGQFWDNLTADLPNAAVHGITADRASSAVYVATSRGVFYTSIDLTSLGPAQLWTLLPGLPQAPAMDVKLDDQGNQLWVALDGFGVYSTLAPHRWRDPRVVSSADLIARATAPGSLVTVLGAKVQAAHAGDLALPILDANDNESQIQIPFEARGASLSLAIETSNSRITLPAVPLETSAPAIFTDRDGSPMLLDADTGTMLDTMTPAHSRAHVQILATGLGSVNPAWPTGLAGPLQNPPRVTGTVTAYLDRQAVVVTRAVLAPYIGFYLVEVEIPKIVNYGPAELYIEVDGRLSNRVRVYIEP